MTTQYRKKLVREDDLVAEVEVEVIDAPDGWGPYLSIDDAEKLDRVRRALRDGDFAAAHCLGKVYRLTPVSSRAAG